MGFLNEFSSDLGRSRRFQVHCFLSFVLGIVFFIGALFFLMYDAQDNEAPSFRVWMEPVAAVPFPALRFQTLGTDRLSDISCQINSTAQTPMAKVCKGFQKSGSCWTVDASQLSAHPNSKSLTCTMKFDDGPAKLGAPDGQIYVEFEDARLDSLEITPCTSVEVGMNAARYEMLNGTVAWGYRTHASYTGTFGNITSISLKFTVNTFTIDNFAPFNAFPGWLVVASMGGLFVFLYGIHKSIFFCIGDFLPKDSALLNGATGGADPAAAPYEPF
eukprot:CAMPEP_0170743348 /NCGR_PEP_ID=MMETSP0437-20130122/7219_1 /TAXON_ID=0 /ORGANISM="Sexangularia sp." /LENGTH=272 /DNA_ID=CAMNT_0011082009 /DNA_START=46 /DNA_END=864 /DNA_ORIENTATION=+